MVHVLDKHAVLDILQTIKRCTAVDRSAPTLMCTLGVGNSILKQVIFSVNEIPFCGWQPTTGNTLNAFVQYGLEFSAEHVLPMLTPLLIAQELNVQQFAKYMLFVKDILRKIEEKRGVAVTDSGFIEARQSPTFNGNLNKDIAIPTSTSSNKTSWDVDWVPTTIGPAITQSSTTNMSSSQPAMVNKPIVVTSVNLQSSISAVSSHQMALSCPPVDVEWPPQYSSDVIPQLGDNKDKTVASSSDNIDPFSNWPSLHSGSLNASVPFNNGKVASSSDKYGSNLNTSNLNGQNFRTANNSNSWAFNTQNSTQPLRRNQGNSTVDTGNFNSGGLNQNSIGYLKKSREDISTSGTYTDDKTTDLGSIFASGKIEQTAPRLAPPPPTAVGRGRGRGRGRGSHGQPGAASEMRSDHAKSQAELPPLVDLL
ncbi:hypothetical protein U1Q18_007525 [Sarracenia purpurea var. burkii]